MTRDLRLDILRVLSILAVILIRITAVYETSDTFHFDKLSSWIVSVIHRSLFWSVPVLFMVSGALLLDNRNESTEFFYKKRMSKVLIPTLFWSVFFLMYLYIFEDYTLFNLAGVFVKSGAFDHLWFMYAIIGLYVFTPYFRVFLQHLSIGEIKKLIIILFIFTILNNILSQYFENEGTIFSFFIGYIGYFFLGHYLYKNRDSFIKYSHLYGVIFFSLVFFSSVADIIREHYFHIDISIFTIFLPLQAITLYLFLLNTQVTFKLSSNLWINLSIFSFGTYLVHAVFILVFEPYMTMNDLLYLPLFYLLVLVCSYIFVYTLSKIKYLKSII
ncbi:MAG: acyltransferase family protein [Campylobacterales bacterium]|nr:acyltransferase family protein [Campylobacterales bacterium]